MVDTPVDKFSMPIATKAIKQALDFLHLHRHVHMTLCRLWRL